MMTCFIWGLRALYPVQDHGGGAGACPTQGQRRRTPPNQHLGFHIFVKGSSADDEDGGVKYAEECAVRVMLIVM